MRSNYRPIGDYIQKVENRNKNLKVTRLLGLSMTKEFRETTSNIVGTDMSVYKIMTKYQFACDFMSPIRVGKLPVVLKLDDEPNLVSPAYPVFEVKDRSQLHPEYLMMWFRRSEFDRFATFKCDAAIRGGYEWKELCETLMPTPSITRQKEIVAEYNVIQNRIKLNQQLIQKLEETAQAIYKHWFVDFEFPISATQAASMGKPELEGRPYKSSGGEMEDSELGEIPKGWKAKMVRDFGCVITGKTPSSENPEDFGDDMPFVTPGDFNDDFKFITGSERCLSPLGVNRLKNKILSPNTVVVTCIGSDMGKVAVIQGQCITNQQMNSVLVAKNYYSDFLYYSFKSMYHDLRAIAMGSSTMPMISKSEFEILSMLRPSDTILHEFHRILQPLNQLNLIISRQYRLAEKLRELLLSKLATIEDQPPARNQIATRHHQKVKRKVHSFE